MPARGRNLWSPEAIFLAGPTAVGKSAIALRLAERLGGEIISVDSMQVYRGLDIGTAKPSVQERARIRHHLIDVADLDEAFDAAKFCAAAKRAEDDIRQRGLRPIFVGGTGLYFSAYLRGLGVAPAGDPKVRQELESFSDDALFQELAQRDPETAERIDRRNRRRLLRAVEVIRLTGKPFSVQRSDWESVPQGAGLFFAVARVPADLHFRIADRVQQMFQQGLVGEVEQLLRHGLEQNRTAMQAIGYRQVAEYLRGVRSLAATIELIRVRTRQFAKRQLTWFRKQLPLEWIAADNDADDRIADQILRRIASD